MHRRLALLGCTVVLLGFGAIPAAAQNAALQQAYGDGVHAYFSHDFPAAYDALSAAVRGGSVDPRVYYFRGLAQLKLGRPGPLEAQADFNRAAELEANTTATFYHVGKALERVQGVDRQIVEQYRDKARRLAAELAARRRALRYEQRRSDQNQILEEQAAAAPQSLPAVPLTPPAASAASDVFSSGPLGESIAPATPPAAKPAQPAVPAAAAARQPIPPPAVENDPFAVPNAPAAPANVPPAKDRNNNPFAPAPRPNAPAAAPNDPFVPAEPAAPAAPSIPGPASPAESDPFMDEPPPPADNPPTEG